MGLWLIEILASTSTEIVDGFATLAVEEGRLLGLRRAGPDPGSARANPAPTRTWCGAGKSTVLGVLPPLHTLSPARL